MSPSDYLYDAEKFYRISVEGDQPVAYRDLVLHMADTAIALAAELRTQRTMGA